MTRSERFFFWLNRFNAIAIFVLVLVFAYLFAWSWWEEDQWQDQNLEQPDVGEIVGAEYDTPTGRVVAYLPNGIDESGSEVRGSNVSLVHLESGRTARLLPQGSSQKVVNWQMLEGRDGTVGYLARVADDDASTEDRADIIVGSLSTFKQRVIARNVRYLDAPTIYGNATLAMIVWPEEDTGRLVTVDLGTMQVTRSQPIPLPSPPREVPE